MRDTTFRIRLFVCFMLVVLVGMGVPFFYARQTVEQGILSEAVRATQREAQAVGMMLEDNPAVTLSRLPEIIAELSQRLDVRITYMDSKGNVLVDGRPSGLGDVEDMDNHKNREEIIQALAWGKGNAVRQSGTLQAPLVYAAVTVSQVRDLPEGVVRVSTSFAGVQDRTTSVTQGWVVLFCIAIALSLLFAFVLSARLENSLKEMMRLVENIATGTAERRRLYNLPGREFRNLARAVNDMVDRIEENIHTISQQRAQLETILDIMDEGVLVLGAHGRIRLANKALIRLFPDLVHGIGQVPIEVIPVTELQQAFDSLMEKPHDWIAATSLEVEVRPNTVLSVRMVRPREAIHDVLVVAVFHDISEMMRLMHIRRDFVANVSHELRTPLTAIQGYAETLLDLPGEDIQNRTRFLKTICRHAEHMNRMVEDLLVLARIESGSVPMQLEDVDVVGILESVVMACQTQAAAKQVRITINIAPHPSGGLHVLADTHFLSQVFRNLIENACRYAPEHSEIAVTGVPWATGYGEEAVFSIIDQGPGIPPSDLVRVFERFYCVEKHRSGPSSTGLGLAICKHIVERHNGRIWVENMPGAAFRFTIPLAKTF